MTTSAGPQIVTRPPVAASVLSDHTRRVYAVQRRLFNDWCDDVDLRSMPAEPLTVARYLAVRAAWPQFAIVKIHQWAGHDSPAKIAV